MWQVLTEWVFDAIQWVESWCGDWGLAIIIITIIFRLLIYPITRKQFRTSYKMQKLQPQIKAIQEKYAGDQRRIQEEMQRIYKEAHFNPLAGCLPMILQMPIFMLLYNALLQLSNGSLAPGVTPTFYNIMPNLGLKPSDAFAAIMTNPSGFGDGLIAFLPYLISLLIFGASMIVPMLLMNNNQTQQKSTLIMMLVMTAVMLWIGWSAPAGVLLYWDVSSIIGVAQQFGSRAILKHEDEHKAEEMVDVTPVKVSVDRKEHKARPRKKN
ncbi:MAG: YidC/Oxa1 family membrane protein insertase [Coriobacteriales bacterium]|jgi:YidC/Oxa1 family membrane protein insertase|nr:YidC/Oxa1 family membrane protein insertase [Coriobacteriales bacterium]